MKEIIAYCGMVCSECRTYLATTNNDNQAKAKIAAEWSQKYHLTLKAEDINCDGCLAVEKRRIGYCRICEIRKCGTARNIPNCGYCAEYPCDKLNIVHNNAPQVKAKLEAIRTQNKSTG